MFNAGTAISNNVDTREKQARLINISFVAGARIYSGNMVQFTESWVGEKLDRMGGEGGGPMPDVAVLASEHVPMGSLFFNILRSYGHCFGGGVPPAESLAGLSDCTLFSVSMENKVLPTGTSHGIPKGEGRCSGGMGIRPALLSHLFGN